MAEINIDGAVYETNFTKKFEFLKSKKQKKINKTEIRAFIPGLITDIPSFPGKKVKANMNIISLEAMKMVNEIALDYDIVVRDVLVKVGDTVEKNQILIKYSIPKPKKEK